MATGALFADGNVDLVSYVAVAMMVLTAGLLVYLGWRFGLLRKDPPRD